MLVDVATHIKGGHIDHLYWRGDPAGVWMKPTLENNLIERYSPYYTDNDAWLVTLQKLVRLKSFDCSIDKDLIKP